MATDNPIQNHKRIKLDDLLLWTENPREPVKEGSVEEVIIGMALNDGRKKWNLQKLLNDMGDYYDESELPTVVKEGDKYIVYDGNRRVALIKYLKNPNEFPSVFNPFEGYKISENIKSISELPCNVCDKSTALQNVYRKHVDNSSWGTIERDIFLHEHVRERKSNFLLFDEKTGLISENKKMNQRFVKDDILTETNMNSIGFSFKDSNLQSVYSDDDAKLILREVAKLVIEEKVTTRKRLVAGTLGERIIAEAEELKNKIIPIESSVSNLKNSTDLQLGKLFITPKTKIPKIFMFPYELYLEQGDANDLYRDIKMIDEFYQKSKNKFTVNFPRLLRFSLRILVEIASNQSKTKGVDGYTQKYFDDARIILSKDNRNSLSSNDMTQGELYRLLRDGGHYNREDLQEGSKKMTELLQAGAHNYTDATDYKTACTMSIIVGAMLQISHRRKDFGA